MKALYGFAFVLVGLGLIAIAGCNNGTTPTTTTVPVTSSSTLPAASATTVALPAISGQAASAFIPAPTGGTAGSMSATASNVAPSVPSGTATVPPLAFVRASNARGVTGTTPAGWQTVEQVGVYYLITPSTSVTYPTSGNSVPTIAITFPFSVAGQAWYIATFDTANPQYGWFMGLIGCTTSGSTVDCIVSSPGPSGDVPSTGYTLLPHPYAFAIYQGSS